MITLSTLHQYVDNFMHFDLSMDISKIDPYMCNGLMVKGRQEIKKIGFGVSASLAFFQNAKEEKCDAIIVHHAFNIPSYNHYDSIFQNRIGFLIKNDISLFGYHFLLDAHPIIGNNVQILKHIGAKPTVPYNLSGEPWGWMGEFEKPRLYSEIVRTFPSSSRMVSYDFGPKEIKKVVAISGKGAPRDMGELIRNNVDLYITGEVHEWIRELFREAKINFLAAGHYATEVFGVKALLDKVSKDFPHTTCQWIDLSNEV
jgi:dinuclear metal center YbgI/SA1388 family protein